ncbi:MAG: phosphate ABC transporter substrate-binding protein [Eubacteriales bacterium]|nr:phosphate ABC transporter substrate-binding protein [Bacillota bacterium]MDQ7788655.1 phosphate ABC transporter substrate-binding protein [Clostridia bacterium]MDZ4043563.1 phosphate ABC transporter substrate-binding protein [Eubacteriales bacterium]MBU4532509.1 phosphate ABC transporter substrate-binding protein [Bacillota bacterium]MBU4554524.1 phosphate ABC transporter substrate-binding protein [Bacillota bacterium]
MIKIGFKSKWMLIMIVSLLAAFVVAGCGGGTPDPGADNQQPGEEPAIKGTLTTAGSTSVQPLSEEFAQAFMAKYPGTNVMVQGGGSSQGVKAANEGIADFGASSRNLKDEEKAYGLTEVVVCLDGIAVVVHPENSFIEDLSIEDVRKVFAGDITNWKDLGGPDSRIMAVTREAGSGTRGAFEEMIMKDAKISDAAIVQPSNGGIHQAVAGDKNAIGYLSMGYLDDKVKTIKIDGVEASVDNIKAGTYKVSRPFIFMYKGEASPLLQAFTDFCLSAEGQAIVAKHYITVN